MNELNSKKNSEAQSPGIKETADCGDDEAIYSILARISEKWGYPSADVSAQEDIAPVKRPDESPKATVSGSNSEWGVLEKTVILAGPERTVATEPIAQPEPEKPVSEWDTFEKTVIISKPASPSLSLKEVSILSSSGKEAENRYPSSDVAPAPAWDELDETIRITPCDTLGDSALDETLILGNRAGKRSNISKASDRLTAIPRSEAPPIDDNDNDDIILETVILGPGSYE